MSFFLRITPSMGVQGASLCLLIEKDVYTEFWISCKSDFLVDILLQRIDKSNVLSKDLDSECTLLPVIKISDILLLHDDTYRLHVVPPESIFEYVGYADIDTEEAPLLQLSQDYSFSIWHF